MIGKCLLCGRAAPAGRLFDSDLCAAGWSETRRVRFATPGELPAELAETLERLIRGEDVPGADEDALLARYQQPSGAAQ